MIIQLSRDEGAIVSGWFAVAGTRTEWPFWNAGAEKAALWKLSGRLERELAGPPAVLGSRTGQSGYSVLVYLLHRGGPMTAVANPATVQECLRMGSGFSQGDRNWIAEQLGTLDTRLASFHADATALEISVKDRESRGQKVTLECRIGGREKIVTTSSGEDLHAAVMDVRDDLRRRLNDAKTRQEPRHNRHLRDIASPEVGELEE